MIRRHCRDAFLASTAIALCFQFFSSPVQAQGVTPNPAQWGLGLIGAPAAWAAGYTGAGVTVAVTDSGIDPTHPAFAGKIDLARSRNLVLPSAGAVYDANQINDFDPGGHGTHVAGIVAASGTSSAPGVAYNASLVVLRAVGGVAVPQIGDPYVAAMNYFAGLQNVMIYNASYGPDPGKGFQSWPASTIDPKEAAAALKALAAGKIVVAATGNERDTNPVAGQNPSGLALYPFIKAGTANATAGAYQDGGNNYNLSNLLQQSGLIIGVTAVGQDKTIAYYANYCGVTASWCLAAPGGDLSKDTGIYATLPGGNYGAKQGTSMATPMVSGALAVLQQAYPTYSAQDLAHVLFATAENVGGQAGVNAIYGYGMLRLDRAVAGPTTLAAGTDVSIAAKQMTYWSQPLTTAGAFSKSGDGYLMIAGRTTASGDVSVNGGALGVGGTLTLNTQLTVAEGAMLAGFGTINGSVFVNGTLNAGQLPNYADVTANSGGALPATVPLTGTSPGTLTFQGNVTLGASATMRVNVDGNLQVPGGPGTYDKIIVNGAGYVFTANGTLMPILRGIIGGNNNYTAPVGSTYTFLTATNGASVAGSFSGLTQPGVGLDANTRFDVIYNPTSLTLSVTPLTYAAFAQTQNLSPNQQAIAQAIDAIRPSSGAKASRNVEQPLFNALDQETSDNIDDALSALSGQGHAATPRVLMGAMAGFSDLIGDRQMLAQTGIGDIQAGFAPSLAFAYASASQPSIEARAAAVPFPGQGAPRSPDQWTPWGQGYGSWSRVGDAGGQPGYRATGAGFAAGVDRLFSNDLMFGAAVGFSRTSSNSADMTGRADSYAGAAYATFTPGRFIFTARLAGGPTTTGTSRTLVLPGDTAVASGKVSGWGGLVAGEAGYRVDLSNVVLRPFVGLTAQAQHQNAFSESSDFGLILPAQNYSKLTTAVGTWITTTVQAGEFTLTPAAKLAWAHDLRDTTLTTEAALFDAPFAISMADPGRDAAVVGLKLGASKNQHLGVFASYTGEFRRNANVQQLAGGVRVNW